MSDARPSWLDAFASFAERKTRAAVAASMPPYVTELASPEARVTAVGNAWSESRFDGPFYVTPPGRERPACSLVFVQSADGDTEASDPSSLGGGNTDQHLIYEGLSRVAADAVLAGARTVRGGHTLFSVWHPELVELRRLLGLPRHPAQIVATLTGLEIDRALLFNVPEVPVILLTVPQAATAMDVEVAERPWIRLLTMQGADQLGQAVRCLRNIGIGRISCIGGRTLAARLLGLGVVDDLYLTTSPRAGGTPGTPLPAYTQAASVILRKRGTAEETGVLFEHIHLHAQG